MTKSTTLSHTYILAMINNNPSCQNCSQYSLCSVSAHDKLSRPALGRSSSFHSHSSKTSGLAQLPTKPQMEERIEQKPRMKKEVNIQGPYSKPSYYYLKESVYCEDSGYLSTFGGTSSNQRQYLLETFSVKPNYYLIIHNSLHSSQITGFRMKI